MPTDAIIGWSAGAIGLAVVLFKLIHEIFRSRRPVANGDHDRHFKAVFAKLAEQRKLIDELTTYVRRRGSEIAVDTERHATSHETLKRIEQDVDSLLRRSSR